MKYTTRSFTKKFGKDGSLAKGSQPSVTPWRVIFWVIFASGAGMILAAALFGLGLCWKVTAVEVKGSEFHDAEVILAVADIQAGDLSLGFDASDIQSKLKQEYPIISSVKVKRGLDGTVTLQVKEEKTLYYTCHHVNYYLISGDDMEVIHISSTDDLYRAYGAIYLGLPEEASLQVGKKISFDFLPYQPVNPPEELSTYEIVTEEAEEEYAYTLELVERLENSPFFSLLNGVDTSDRYDVYFVFNDHIMVRLGNMKELDRKLEQAVYIVNNKLSSGDIPAVIDVSNPAKSTLRQNPQLEMPDWCPN